MNRKWPGAYAPAAIFVILQGLVIALAPSPPRTVTGFQAPPPLTDGGASNGNTPSPWQSGQPTPAVSGPSGIAEPGQSGLPLPGQSGVPGINNPGQHPAPAASCRGLQQSITYYSPPCATWAGGDNGGSTYQGIAASSIKIVDFSAQQNAQVNALLQAAGVGITESDYRAFAGTAISFIQKHYQLYGRKIDYVRYVGNFPISPADFDAAHAAAAQVIKMKPFAVIWNTNQYASVFDDFVRAGIPVIGGWWFDRDQFSQRRPYRYDRYMNGTEADTLVGNFYCANMAKRSADHSGTVIAPSIGRRGSVTRKVGIVVSSQPAYLNPAKRLADRISKCNNTDTPVITYDNDVNRAQEQATSITAGLVSSKVTTLICICDYLAAGALTHEMSAQQYYPENLLAGQGLTDYDVIARSYDPRQWAHAFGPSLLTAPLPAAQQDATRVWRDAGRTGTPCGPCELLVWPYFEMLGGLLQQAGPQLTPLTMERGALAWPARGGWTLSSKDPHRGLHTFGSGDYTAESDYRVVYWDGSATSAFDNRPGSYVALQGGKRFRAEETASVALSGIPVRP